MNPPTIAVFTKNRLNPAYEAARIGADRVAARMGARTVHYVPVLPDDTAVTLAARVLTQEHLIYPKAVAELLAK